MIKLLLFSLPLLPKLKIVEKLLGKTRPSPPAYLRLRKEKKATWQAIKLAIRLYAKGLLFFIMLLQLLSCTPGAPYEIKSPCVSADPDFYSSGNPCVRRPVNLNIDIV